LFNSYKNQFELWGKPAKIDLTEHLGGLRWLF
jgi:hypothetical protein